MKMREPWNGLTEAWKRMDETEDLIMWKKSCAFFECVVEQIHDGTYSLAINTPMDGVDVLSVMLTSNREIDAFDEANRIIAEFIKEGSLTVSRVAPDEVRFVQVSHTPEGKLYGLDEFGKLWVRSNDLTKKNSYHKWIPVDMKKEESLPVISG